MREITCRRVKLVPRLVRWPVIGWHLVLVGCGPGAGGIGGTLNPAINNGGTLFSLLGYCFEGNEE